MLAAGLSLIFVRWLGAGVVAVTSAPSTPRRPALRQPAVAIEDAVERVALKASPPERSLWTSRQIPFATPFTTPLGATPYHTGTMPFRTVPLSVKPQHDEDQDDSLSASAELAPADAKNVGHWKFDVPIAPETSIDNVVYLKVPGAWRPSMLGVDGLCIAIVQTPEECSSAALTDLPCKARPLWSLSAPAAFLGFQLPRPAFALGAAVQSRGGNHLVCLWARDASGQLNSSLADIFPAFSDNPILLGNVSYYPMPELHFSGRVERIGVRTFLNPGWHKDIQLECRNCSTASRIAVRPQHNNYAHCKGLKGAIAAAVLALQNERSGTPNSVSAGLKFGHGSASVPWPKGLLCGPPKHGPCHGYIDSAFTTGHWRDGGPVLDGEALDGNAGTAAQTGGTQVAKFLLESHKRLATKDRRHLFHHRSAVCFYPDEGSPQGWLAGYIEFHMDGPDVQAFVGFVCFYGIGLPLICMVTVLLHVNKQQRCKQHVRDLRLQLQREQLELELNHREPETSQRSSSASRSSSTRSAGNGDAESALLAGSR